MTDVLIVQNSSLEGPGTLGGLLENDGFRILTVHAKRQPLPDETYGLLVVLGGPQSANDNLAYLREEQNVIRRHLERDMPVLGICLGSQLMARSLGAQVERGPVPEIGFYHDIHVDDTCIFSGFSSPFTVFHWHHDGFGLAKGATRLAHSDHYATQAFRAGTGIGIQFHLEVTGIMIQRWLDSLEVASARTPGIHPDHICQEIDMHLDMVESNMKRFYRNLKSELRL